LNGRNRKVCQIGHLPLPDIHTIENWGSTIDFQARHISLPRRRRANDHGENVRQDKVPALVFSSDP
jgi:hypothetical protein